MDEPEGEMGGEGMEDIGDWGGVMLASWAGDGWATEKRVSPSKMAMACWEIG